MNNPIKEIFSEEQLNTMLKFVEENEKMMINHAYPNEEEALALIKSMIARYRTDTDNVQIANSEEDNDK